jgi:hypothetical protein
MVFHFLQGYQFDFEGDWGELLVKKQHPVLAVLDMDKGDISIIDGIPDDLSVGQVNYWVRYHRLDNNGLFDGVNRLFII